MVVAGLAPAMLTCTLCFIRLSGTEQFYAAHRFYDEDQARYRGGISPASPAGLARAPGGPEARGMPELLHLSAGYRAFRFYGGRGFSALPGDNGDQPGQRTLGGPNERYFNPRNRGRYRFSTCT